MNTDSNEENCTPPEIVQAANTTTQNLLPTKSRRPYDTVYRSFMESRDGKKANSFSENVLLAYFAYLLAEKYKPSTLWTQYSMLRITLEEIVILFVAVVALTMANPKHQVAAPVGKGVDVGLQAGDGEGLNTAESANPAFYYFTDQRPPGQYYNTYSFDNYGRLDRVYGNY